MTSEFSTNKFTPKKIIEFFFKSHYPNEMELLKENEDLNSLRVDYPNFIGTLEDNGYSNTIKNNFSGILETSISVINEICKKEYVSIILEDMPYNVYLRGLDSKHINKFISTTAMVKSVSPIRPRVIIAVYECKKCQKEFKILDHNKSTTKIVCECSSTNLELILDKSKFINTQILRLEEPLELRKGGTSREFMAIIEGDLVNPEEPITPGSVVNISGFMKSIYNNKTDEWNFKIEVNNMKPITETYKDIILSQEDINNILTLSKEHDLFKNITNSILPTIFGYNQVKEGLVLQLFGGASSNISGTLHRLDMHVLLVGDPGISKSEITRRMAELSPKGFYVNGAESSKAGILAVAIKDELTGRWTIEAGAMPLADQGLLCIDEMDKMIDKHILALNEPMEQQTVTITKAGLNVTMNARTPILAAANPKYQRFISDKNISEQILVPFTTLSRFDLVYALQDVPDVDKDLELAKNLLKDNYVHDMDVIDSGLIRKYVAYAKREIHPKLTPEAIEVLSNFYANIRKSSIEDIDSHPTTPRNLQALQRMAIAYARIHLREFVTHEDANEVIRIYADAFKTLGLSPENAGILEGVPSNKDLQNIGTSKNIVQKYYNEYGSIMLSDTINEAITEISTTCSVDTDHAIKLFNDNLEEIENSGNKI